jgi:beta-phosphoglucomutase-like phosphatase (HAD superfamily)
MNTTWIMSSKEFIADSHQNKSGKNAGVRSIWFNGKNSKAQSEHVKPQYQKYVVTDFRRILQDEPDH